MTICEEPEIGEVGVQPISDILAGPIKPWEIERLKVLGVFDDL